MKNIINFFILTAFFSVSVNAESMKDLLDQVKSRNKQDVDNVHVSNRGDKPREHVIDSYRVERSEKEKSYIDVCRNKKFSNFNVEYECFSDARDNFNSDYPDRGTHQYGEIFYRNLSQEDGKLKRDELVNKIDIVSYYPKPGNEKIEINVEDIKKEIFYIERYILNINPKEYETR